MGFTRAGRAVRQLHGRLEVRLGRALPGCHETGAGPARLRLCGGFGKTSVPPDGGGMPTAQSRLGGPTDCPARQAGGETQAIPLRSALRASASSTEVAPASRTVACNSAPVPLPSPEPVDPPQDVDLTQDGTSTVERHGVIASRPESPPVGVATRPRSVCSSGGEHDPTRGERAAARRRDHRPAGCAGAAGGSARPIMAFASL
jgi:hypothetical protein